jgi:hypothetical protein
MKTKFYKTSFLATPIVTSYIFSQSNGTYTPLTVGFTLGDAATNDEFFTDPNVPLGGTTVLGPGMPIGFNFTYNDTVYNKFGVCANGWIILGNGSVDFSNANLNVPLSSAMRKVIAGAGRDLEAQTNASISYATLGTAPNRTLIIQWKDYTRFNNVALDSLNFQIRLEETTNFIHVVYGKMLTGSAQTNLTQVGLKGGTATDLNMRTTAANWTATTSTLVNTAGCPLNGTIFPPNGLTFTWIPPIPCTIPPTAGIASLDSLSNCPSLKVLSLTGSSIGIGISLQWLVSADNITWDTISGANTTTYSVIQTSSNYYRCVITCSGVTDSSNVILVNGVSSATTCYCNTSLHANANCQAGNINDFSIGGTSFANLGSGCGQLNGNSYSVYADTGSTTTTLFAGFNYNFNLTSTGNGTISLWIDYNQDGSFDVSEYTQIAATAVANTANSVLVTIPGNALNGKTGMRVRYRLTGGANGAANACTQNYGSGETEDYFITINQPPPCVAPPTAGTASSSANAVCAGVSYNLQLNGNTSGLGLTYQWQSSLDSLTWSNISGAVNSFFATSSLQSTYYRCYLTCSGQSDTSSVVLLTINPAQLCYCTTALHSNNNCAPAGNINDVFITGTTLSNLGTGCASNAGQSYSSYTPSGSNTASLDIGSSYSFNVAVTNANNTISLWIDYDQSGTFDATEWTQVSAAAQIGVPNTVTISIPVSALSGQTGMRIRTRQTGAANGATDACTTMASGETEDYIITLVQPPPCVAPPIAGMLMSSDSIVCVNINYTLTLNGATSGTGMTYTWQSSTDNLVWTSISGASNSFYATSQTVATYYRCILTCSGLSDTSTVVFISLNAINVCYCTSNATNTADGDIGNVTFGTLNNGVAFPSAQNPAATNTYTDFTSLPAQQFTQNTNYPISISQINSANFFPARVSVFIDYNQDGDFTDLDETAFTATTTNAGGAIVTGNVLIPATATAGLTRMRVVLVEVTGPGGVNLPCGTYQFGETEDYTIEVVAQLPCVAPPIAGLAVSSDSAVCATTFTLTLNGASTGSGMTYQWQSSTDSVTWLPIAGANTTFHATTQTQSTYYRCVLTCSGLNDTSSVVYVFQNPANACYCASAANSTADADVGNVTFGTLNNGIATPISGNTAATGTYTDFTALPIQTYNRSTSYTMSVSQITSNVNFTASRITVFIDYNQNGSFNDVGERVLTGTTTAGAAGNPTVTGTVTIPATALLGNTRMRVILSAGGGFGLQNPCGNYNFGETEDYTVNIDVFNTIKSKDTPKSLLQVFPNPTNGKTILNYSIIEKTTVQIEVFNLLGKRINTLVNDIKPAGVYTQEFDVNQLNFEPGAYFIKITAEGKTKTIRFVVF